ncbi:MAG: GNAT family N-acetyltransferase [Synergistaceae bacterium]|jgi:N-acetylglutamate synthase-like GNAT family acetyltransferase|nr:GNAT family N-acetyltransferase [Synergistaceae bacterium]
MEPDGPLIRAAKPDEAELLSHICFRAKSYWEYPRELMNHWLESGALSVSPEETEERLTYVAQDEEGEIQGFYSLELSEDESRVLCLCVLPELVGTDIKATLFLHACAMAEESGARYLAVASDMLESGFYEEMGAEPVGERIDRTPAGDWRMIVYRMNL